MERNAEGTIQMRSVDLYSTLNPFRSEGKNMAQDIAAQQRKDRDRLRKRLAAEIDAAPCDTARELTLEKLSRLEERWAQGLNHESAKRLRRHLFRSGRPQFGTPEPYPVRPYASA